ncbi:MAG: hypothetical protein QM270_04515 [Bacillota bacterium]|nr:hypothetical protein [Bacillota bacterium]
MSSAFISSFQSPVGVDDLRERYVAGMSNIDILLADRDEGWTVWTVPKDARTGDRVYFMCAKTSRKHIRDALREAKALGDVELIRFAEEQKEKYDRCAGKILAAGVVVGRPYQSSSEWKHQYWRSPWYARIEQLEFLDRPVDITEFRDFIFVSRTGAITRLDGEQEGRLLRLIRP